MRVVSASRAPVRRCRGAEDTLGATSATLRGTLVEGTHEYGVFAAGAALTVEASMIRYTGSIGVLGGTGIAVQTNKQTGTAVVRTSVVEANVGLRDLGGVRVPRARC